MIITHKRIPRRTVLRGIGASLALPLLDGMIPALTALQRTAAQPVRRFGVVYVPNGMAMGSWTPASEGAGFELTPILQPLAAFKDQMIVVAGLSGPPSNGGVHASASTRFLTGISASRSEYDLQAGMSIDQLIAWCPLNWGVNWPTALPLPVPLTAEVVSAKTRVECATASDMRPSVSGLMLFTVSHTAW